DDGGGTYARMDDAAGDAAASDASAGTLSPDAIAKLLIDKKVFLNGDVLTSLIEAGLDGLDDYEGQETALASFPADDDRQNESRLLVEDEDGVTREVVVPRLRWLARLLPRSRKSKETWRRILEERSNLMASAVCAPPDFDDEDGEDLKDSYFVDDDESDRAVKITVDAVSTGPRAGPRRCPGRGEWPGGTAGRSPALPPPPLTAGTRRRGADPRTAPRSRPASAGPRRPRTPRSGSGQQVSVDAERHRPEDSAVREQEPTDRQDPLPMGRRGRPHREDSPPLHHRVGRGGLLLGRHVRARVPTLGGGPIRRVFHGVRATGARVRPDGGDRGRVGSAGGAGGGGRSAISELMWAEEHGGAMTILDNVYYVVYIAMLVALVYGIDANQQPTLWQLGILDVVASVLYLLMIYVLVECKGWLNPYKKGLLRSFSIKNLELVRGILVMSVPLTIGGIVSTCMWEILTVFATHMGAAEVAAWTILGSIWGVFEYLPTGFATAAELLVSRYLANAQPAHAKVAAYKSLLFSLVAAAATAGLFLHFRVGVVAAYTDVEQISDMLMDLILLVGIANIVMVVGSTAYTILCSQNRANLATVMYTTLSFTATMPLSSYFVYTKGYDLQSVVFSLIVGYSLSSVVLVVIVLTTNWTKCSEAVVRSADAAQEEQERLSMLKLKRKNEKLIAESDDQGRPNSGLYEL
ncbi:hypothetical protein THAOC_10329, partial [Thalassiosira oceanica]